MIRYDLKCAEGHGFEAWFASSTAFDEQAAQGFVTCALCGSSKVEKALMAPRVPKKGGTLPTVAEGAPSPRPAAPVLSAPGGAELEGKLAALRAEIEKNSTYVGKDFASEARRIHVGEADQRAIHGEATPNDVKSLVEDGVPVAPLPFLPRRDD